MLDNLGIVARPEGWQYAGMHKDLVCLTETKSDEATSGAAPLLANPKGRSGDDLYFVRVEDGPCKIGRTRNIKNRLRIFQTHCHEDIDLVALLPGKGFYERVWHAAFNRYRLRGEWFEWTDGLQRAIDAAVAGEEWIAVLDAPGSYVDRAKREWKQAGGIPFHRNAQEWADAIWRERIADEEEDVSFASFRENHTERPQALSGLLENFGPRSLQGPRAYHTMLEASHG